MIRHDCKNLHKISFQLLLKFNPLFQYVKGIVSVHITKPQLILFAGSKVSCSVKLASTDKKEPDGFWMDSEQYLVDDGSLCGGRAGSKPFSTKLSLDGK